MNLWLLTAIQVMLNSNAWVVHKSGRIFDQFSDRNLTFSEAYIEIKRIFQYFPGNSCAFREMVIQGKMVNMQKRNKNSWNSKKVSIYVQLGSGPLNLHMQKMGRKKRKISGNEREKKIYPSPHPKANDLDDQNIFFFGTHSLAI